MAQMTVLVPPRQGVWAEQTRDVPEPGPGEVLIHSTYLAVNNAEVMGMDRAEQVDEAVVAGYETAGTVVAVGEGVDETLVGTQVGACTPGAFAEYVAAVVRHTLPVPDSLPLAEAAALPTCSPVCARMCCHSLSTVRPVLHGVLPLSDADQAAALVREGRARGKVVLAFPDRPWAHNPRSRAPPARKPTTVRAKCDTTSGGPPPRKETPCAPL